MNKVILVGRLVRDPETKELSSGSKTTRFTLAVNQRFKNKQTGKYEADFIPCVTWGATSKFMEQYINQGDMVSIVGEIRVRSYDAQDGSKRYVTEVNCNEVNMVSSAKSNSHVSKGNNGNKSTGNQENFDDDDFTLMEFDDDEIPFL